MIIQPSTSTPQQSKRILIIKFRHHGDMLLVTPVINSLKACWPDVAVDVLLYEETRAMLAENLQINQIYSIDRRWKKQGHIFALKQELKLLSTLKKQHYDIVLNLADQSRSALLTYITGAPVRIGFAFPKRQNAFWRYCHTQLVDTAAHQSMHTVEQNVSILAPLNLPQANETVTMGYSAQTWQNTQHKLEQCGIKSGNYVVIQPTSRWFFKCWEDQKFVDVIQSLTARGKQVVLTSGPDPREQAMITAIMQAFADTPQVYSLAGQLTLTELAALIDHASLFIGVDSVPMHMAAALQTPCIALFGPSKLQFWRPWQVKGEVIWAGDYGELPDPDSIDTNTQQRFLSLIPTDTVIEATRKWLP
ncbi:putative lipopolysaccharide heptosyltransferase III [Enterobacterales bacterium CwR94]|nr:putative lipopolysaccharide heptosyltransferase III [Enterobacterales bacterium CwR94]